MSLYGLNRRRALVLIAVSGVLVLSSGFLWLQYPSPVTLTIFRAMLGAFLGSIVIQAVVEYLRRGEESKIDDGDDQRLELLTPLAAMLRQEQDVDSQGDVGEFFRTPPAWVDFEENYVVDHPMLDTIFNDVTADDDGLFVIEGKPACGKSFLLYSIGKKLVSDEDLSGPEASILRLKDVDRSRLDRLVDEINSLPEGAYVLVDDIHLEPVQLIDVAERFATQSITLVYATRPVQNFPRNQDERLESFTTKHYQIVSETVASSIVDRYLEMEELSEDELRSVRKECLKHRHDLYLLSTALLTYSDKGEVSDEAIYEWIADNVLDADRFSEPINPAPFLIAIACLYRFEVAVTRSFLTNFLDLSGSDLRGLVREGEVLKPSGNTFALHHSSIAQLIINTAHYESRHSIPPKLREISRSHSMEWHEAAVQNYIEYEPQLAVDILAGITKTEEEGRELAHKLLERIDPTIVATGINPSNTSVENLGSFFALYLGREDRIDDALVAELDQFAQDCDSNSASAWAWTTEILARLNIDAAWTFGDKLAPLLETVEPQMVADILTTISYGEIESLAESIAEDVDSKRIENQLKSTDLPPEELAKVIAKLVWVSPKQFTELAINFDTLLLNVEPQDFPVVLCRVAWGNEDSARKMLNSLSVEKIASYLNNIDNDRHYYQALAAIYLVDPSVTKTLGDELSQTGSKNIESSRYREAAWSIVSETSDVPIDGLQAPVEGPAHLSVDKEELSAYQELKACTTSNDSNTEECLNRISDSHDPLDCLTALILRSSESKNAIKSKQIHSWLTEELTEGLPSNVIETVDATMRLSGENSSNTTNDPPIREENNDQQTN